MNITQAPPKRGRKLLIAAAVLVTIVCVGFFGFAAEITDQRMNAISRPFGDQRGTA